MGRYLHRRGELNPCAKLTSWDVATIRTLYQPHRCTAVSLAQRYGVSVGHIRRIVRGENWHYDGPRLRSGQWRHFTDAQAAIIRAQNKEGWSSRQLAAHYAVSRSIIMSLLRGVTYKTRRGG